jgi:hypothetical protein
MGDIANFDPDDESVVLRGISINLNSDIGRAFISDCSRNSEGILNDGQISEKYGLTLKAWRQLVKTHKALIQAVRAERERRVRSGLAAQESAAELFAKTPAVLGTILNDTSASPRHRIEAARELRATAAPSSDRTAPDRFVISINLGEDYKLVVDKERRPLTPEEAMERRDEEAEQR